MNLATFLHESNGLPSFSNHLELSRFYRILQEGLDTSSILLIAASISIVLSIAITSIALYLKFTSPTSTSATTDKSKESFPEAPGGTWISFSYHDFQTFLSSFLLPDELAVIEAMAGFFVENGRMLDLDDLKDDRSKVWKNKHKIALESGATHKRVYNRNGIIDRLVALDLLEFRESDSSWGKQKQVYRLNISNDFIREYLRAFDETLT